MSGHTCTVWCIRLLLLAGLVFGLAGCDAGGDGAAEETPPDETATPNPSTLTTQAAVLPGDQCPAGGVEIFYGIDDNANGVLDEGERDGSEVICHGVAGAPGGSGTPGTPGTPGAAGAQADILVSAAWTAKAAGADPDGTGPALAMGLDAYATIQAGIDAARAGETIFVYAGTYTEDIIIAKNNLTLRGQNAQPVVRGVSSESTELPGGHAAVANVLVLANNVTIRGFTFQNPNVADEYASGIVLSGANIQIVGNRFFLGGHFFSNAIRTLRRDPASGAVGQGWDEALTRSALVAADAPRDVSGLHIYRNLFGADGVDAGNGEWIMLNGQGDAEDPDNPVLIENNVFAGNNHRVAEILERSEVVVRNNTIRGQAGINADGCGRTLLSAGGAAYRWLEDVPSEGRCAIYIASWANQAAGVGGAAGAGWDMHNVVLTGNTFSGTWNPAIFVKPSVGTTGWDGTVVSNGRTTTRYIEYTGSRIADNTFPPLPAKPCVDYGARLCESYDDWLMVGTDAYPTLQDALAAAAEGAGDSIFVPRGTYTGDVTIATAGVRLRGENRNTTTIQGRVTVTADDVTVEHLRVTAPTQGFGVVVQGVSGATIYGNRIEDVGTDAAWAGTNKTAQGVYMSRGSGSATLSDIVVADNVIAGVGNAGSGTGKGIFIGDTGASVELSTVTISGNTISNVVARDDVVFTGGGRGAYGILINWGLTGGGRIYNLVVENNTIQDLFGFWVHAIGLETDTPKRTAPVTNAAYIAGNRIRELHATKSFDDLGQEIVSLDNPQDEIGLFFEANPSFDTVIVEGNSFAADVVYGVAKDPALAGAVDARNNYWGHLLGPSTADHLDWGSGVGPGVLYDPWCTTDCAP